MHLENRTEEVSTVGWGGMLKNGETVLPDINIFIKLKKLEQHEIRI